MNEKVTLTAEQIAARNPSYSYQDLLDRESNAVPDSLRASTNTYLGSEPIPIRRWTSREFHEQEVEKLWPKVWQMACRESALACPGDYVVYNIVNYSILLVHTEAGELKAYHNSCLHRGRMLKRGAGSGASEIRCPYHGFSWALSGDFKGAPCPWDFKHIDAENFGLPEVKLDTWGGWVFINMDEDTVSLEEYMDILPAHFKRWSPEKRYVSMHVEKIINCNWKAAVEAFIESWHAVATHPQIMAFQGIDNSQYDVWGDNVSRSITPSGVINPSHEDVYTEQDTVDAMAGTSTLIGETAAGENQVQENSTARSKIAEINYTAFSQQSGLDLRSFATHSELMDSILYLLFPNFAPWAGFGPVLTYRHRPNGDDHESCIMDIFLLTEFPKGEKRPTDAVTVKLDADEPFSKAIDIMGETLARIFDQDGSNLPQVQRGMRASKAGKVMLGNYQEIRIRQFHQTIDKYLNR